MTSEYKRLWDTAGWCVVEGVIPPDDLAAAQRALPRLFPTAEEFAVERDSDRNRPFQRWEADKPRFPFESGALNRLVVHDNVIDLAEELLGTARIRLYQGIASAKYSDGDRDYEQLLHADYANHTLVVPRADVGYQQVEMFIYLSDVTAETAATRVVPLELTAGVPVERTYLALDEYASIYAAEEAASGPAGSVLAYRPDVYHRGTAMTAERAARFLLHVAFKPVDTDWLGSQAWPAKAEDLAWHRFVNGASARQLVVVGFPEPGNPYWTSETLDGVAARYPSVDMTPWRSAWSTDRAGGAGDVGDAGDIGDAGDGRMP
jgi:ectoine hydroxylase-related dioxygenase (phytanoyl-CoA dioxygenase family)